MAKKKVDVSVKKGETKQGGTHPIVSLREEIDHLFDNFMTSWPSAGRWFDSDPFRNFGTMGAALSPKVDVSESSDSYEISAELPGLEDKDIQLTLSDNVLTLKGEKKSEREEKEKDHYLSERSFGSFQRTFALPQDADLDKIYTEFKKGVLRVHLPKSSEAKAKTRKIEVNTG